MQDCRADPTREIAYRLEGLEKRYGGRTVLRVLALDIYQGELFVLVGPSGAGKSTLLRLLNFLERPDRGTITFRSLVSNGRNPVPLAARRQVTMVFQRPVLFRGSVYDNVAYGLRLRRQPLEPVVSETLERLGLSDLARMSVQTLSGGEAQRVALGRALVIRPQVLLLDEPTANLDPANVALIEEIIAGVNREQGTTVVLVTHNVFQARRLADRAGLLLDGHLIEVAPVEAFFEAPRDPRTAAFVRGEMVY